MPRPRRRRRFFALGEDRFQLPPSALGTSSVDDPEASTTTGEEPLDAYPDTESPEPSFGGEGFADDAPFAAKGPMARRLKPWRRVSFRKAVLAAVFSAVAGGLLVHHWSKSAVGPATLREPKGVVLLTPGDQEELDAAYAARDARRFDEAQARFTELARKHPDWAALPLEVGRTLLHRHNYLGARAALHGALNQGEDSAAANLLTGVAYDAEKSYPEAEGSFAKAVALDPTQADAYFLWGECLRGQGKLTDAIGRYRSALLRNEDETGAGLYRLKLWLCEVEAGEVDNAARTAIDTGLARPYPPMEALFAAAARELKAGDLHAAAAHLLRARERTDPPVFSAILSDPLFVAARSTPELSQMVHSLSPAPSANPAGAASTPAVPPASPAKQE